MKKLASIAVMVLGAAAFIYGYKMLQRADQGQDQISQAEEKVDRHHGLLLGSRRRYENAEDKLNQAEQYVTKAEINAMWIERGGILLFGIGALSLLYFSMRKKQR